MISIENTGQRGSARFAEIADFEEFDATIDLYQNFILGRSIPEMTRGELKDMVVKVPSHNLVFGGSGAGKTSWLINNIIVRLTSFCVIDPKAEIYNATAPFLQANGFNVVRFDPFRHWENKYCRGKVHNEILGAFNPLAKLDPSSSDFSDEIAGIAESIIPLNPQEAPHWPITARTILESLIAYVVETPNERVTLGRVREIFNGGLPILINLAKDVVTGTTNTYSDSSFVKRKLMRFAGLKSDNKELASVYSTADAHLKFLESMAVSECLAQSNFDFKSFLDDRQRTAVFITAPPKRMESHSKFFRLIISEMINTFSSYGGNPNHPVDLFIDEAATVGHLSALPMAYSYMRGEGLRITCIYQSINQLEKDYGIEAEVFFDNSSSIIVLKVSGRGATEYFSSILGNTTMVEQAGRESLQSIGDLPYVIQSKITDYYQQGGYGGYSGLSYSRPLMTPDELQQLPEELGIVITSGRPALFRKINVFKEDPYCNALRSNPMYE